MIWKYGRWQQQTITYGQIGYDIQNARTFRYVELAELHSSGQIANGMEQAQWERQIKSDSNSLKDAKAGDMLVLQWDEARIIQSIEKKPSLKGGNNFSYIIGIK